MEINDYMNEIGLSQYEKQAYLALLKIGKSKSRQVSRESGVSYGRIYEILDKLRDKGLVTIFPTEPKTFDTIDPKLAFNLIIKKKVSDLNLLQDGVNSIVIPKKQVKQVKGDTTIVLQGKQKQLNMINEMHDRASKEILMIPGVYEPNIARNVYTIRTLNRGVKIKRLIREVNKKNNEILKKSLNLGEEVRKNTLPGLRLTVSDNKEAMISIVNSKERISIYTTNKAFANSMKIFFNSLWEGSMKIERV